MLGLFIINFICSPFLCYKRPEIKNRTIYNNLKYEIIPPSGGQLKLLTSLSASNWANDWIISISSENTPEYDYHYYSDYFNMLSMANIYDDKKYFYLGFFPDKKINNNGPRYIGLFELQYKECTMNTKLIIENPHYIEDPSDLVVFRNCLLDLTRDAMVFLNFRELNRAEQLRYYYEWYYN